jgi:hypothetical protein
MATTTGIFDSLDLSNDLFNIWQQRKGEVEAERLQPLADLLLDNIVWPSILEKKAEIFADLQDKCRTAKHATELQVPVWSFFNVNDYPRYGNNPDRAYEINENGWRQQLALYGPHSLRPLIQAPLWSIVKKTNFCEQLAVRFGKEFTIRTLSTDAVEETDPTGETYYRHTVQLMLNYFPSGLPDYHKETRRKFKAASSARRSLELGEKVALWRSTAEGHYIVYGPLWPASPAPSYSYSACHCGYAHDDDESEEE